MVDESVKYKTSMELFLSAGQQGLPAEDTLLREMQRSGCSRSSASGKLSNYVREGYLEKVTTLKITEKGLDKLNHPTRRRCKPKPEITKTPEEPYGDFPFYPEGEKRKYGGEEISFQDYRGPTEEVKYFKKYFKPMPELYIAQEASEMPLLFQRDENLWGWSMAPIILLAFCDKGAATVREIEETLLAHKVAGRSAYWFVNGLAEEGLITNSNHIWGRMKPNEKEDEIIEISTEGKQMLEGLCKTLYGEDGTLSDLLYSNREVKGLEIINAIDGSRIPPIQYLSGNARTFFGIRYNLSSKSQTFQKESAAETAAKDARPAINLSSPERAEPTHPETGLPYSENKPEVPMPEADALRYSPKPPGAAENPQTPKNTRSQKKSVPYREPNIPEHDIILGRSDDGVTNSYLKKVPDEETVMFINHKNGKDYHVVLIQHGRWTSNGLALQEIVEMGRAKHSPEQLKKSGLVPQYIPIEGAGEDSRSRRVLDLISQKQVDQNQ